MLTYVKRFYYDTALSPSRYSMAVLEELVEPSHILEATEFRTLSTRGRVQRALTRPLVALAEHLRNR